jgi:hypothetical protein
MCSLDRTAALVLLLVFIIVGSSFSTANAHYKDARLDVYKATTVPVIDGIYNMTLNKAQIGGQEKVVDEWNDAAWIEIPRKYGNLTAYSDYKYDQAFLYVADDLVSVTSPNYEGSAGIAFDPKHDGGTEQAKPDDFIVLAFWDPGLRGFFVGMRYGGSDGKYHPNYPYSPAPRGLAAKYSMSTSPYSTIPHVFLEMAIPLSVGDLYKYVNSTIGFSPEAYLAPNLADNSYPCGGRCPFTPDNYADAVFSKTTNPNVTVTPTVVPELPIRVAPLVIVATLVAFVLISKKNSRMVRCTHRQLPWEYDYHL